MSQWRALTPADAINAEHEAGRSPHTAQLIYLPSAMSVDQPNLQNIKKKTDYIIFQRNVLTPDTWHSMDYWRALGKVITIDLDDHYPGLPPSNPAHAFWILNKPGLPEMPVDLLIQAMSHVDALTSPSKIILKDFEHLIPGFHIPNYTRRKWYEEVSPKPLGAPDIEFGYRMQGEGQPIVFEGKHREGSEGWIVFGWGGSISHVDSWVYSGAVEALGRIFDLYPNTRLKFCGHEARLDFLLDKFGDKVIRQSGVKPEHWPYVVSTFDVGLAPLDLRPVPSNTVSGAEPWEGGEFSYDERRSWLKGVEYLSAGIHCIVTRSATYQDLERHVVLIENGEEKWFQALKDMVENIGSRKKLAAEKKTWALKKYSMEANVRVYAEVYERIGNMKRTKGNTTLPGVNWNRIEYETKT